MKAIADETQSLAPNAEMLRLGDQVKRGEEEHRWRYPRVCRRVLHPPVHIADHDRSQSTGQDRAIV